MGHDLLFPRPAMLRMERMAISTAAGLGLSSDRLTAVLNKHIAPVKLTMAVFFTLLGILLVHLR